MSHLDLQCAKHQVKSTKTCEQDELAFVNDSPSIIVSDHPTNNFPIALTKSTNGGKGENRCHLTKKSNLTRIPSWQFFNHVCIIIKEFWRRRGNIRGRIATELLTQSFPFAWIWYWRGIEFHGLVWIVFMSSIKIVSWVGLVQLQNIDVDDNLSNGILTCPICRQEFLK